MLPLNIRTDLMRDISNRPMYVLAVLNTGRWGGRGGGRLPTVFNLAATLLAFRADDKEMNDPRVLSHSLNVEFSRYPSAPVQQFTCFFFVVFFSYCMLESHFSHFSSFTSCFQWDSVLFALLPHESSSHPFLYLSLSLFFSLHMKQHKSVTQFCLDYVWSRCISPSCSMWNTVPQSSRTIMSVMFSFSAYFNHNLQIFSSPV